MSRPEPPCFLPPLTPCNLPLRRCSVPRAQASRRILIQRAGAFGDILMGTPLLAALREAYPDAHLTWLVEDAEQAIDASPYLDEYIRWDRAYWKRPLRRGLYPVWLARVLRFRKVLREARFDVFISFQPEEWPLLARGVNAPVSVGIFDTFRRFYGATKTSRNTRLYSHPFAYPDLPEHRTDQYLLALRALGLSDHVPKQMSLGYTEDDRDAAAAFLDRQGIGSKERLVVLAPWTTWPTRCWPAERFVAVGNALARHGWRVLILGGPKEREATLALAEQMDPRPVAVAGELTFRQMAALIDRTALLITGDTGPMHVAAALETPQVALFGPTSPAWYGPRTDTCLPLLHPVPCGPCDKKHCRNLQNPHLCMTLLTVEEVLAAAQRLLTER